MPYFLQSLEGSKTAVSFYKGKVLRIGRGTDASLRLNSPLVELEHAEIREDEHGYVLNDLSRGAETYVNDRPVSTHRLVSGERIEVGGYHLEVRLRRRGNPLFLKIQQLAAAADETTAMSASSLDLLARLEQEAAADEPDPADDKPNAAADERAVATSASEPLAGQAPAVPRIDYVHAYQLRRGVLRNSLLALACGLVGAGSLLALVRQSHWQIFSPGPLVAPHQAVIENNCRNCHSGWRRVTDSACLECHDHVLDHQTTQAETPTCTFCHTEHRGGDALRLRAEHACIDCHGSLDVRVIGKSAFDIQITDFAPGDHPEFALKSTSAVDPGGIKGFSHQWHLSRLPANIRPDCESCHRRDDEQEIEPVRFEDSCQRCHNLPFDTRFGNEQAPHAAPKEVLTNLSGRYALRPDVLQELRGPDRRRLQGKRLTPERQLSELARLHTERLLRNQCVKCHHTDAAGSQVESLTVRPPNLKRRWFTHANFRHAPHLDLVSCRECHQDAASSQTPSDVLLPGIAICFDCHRPPRPGEQELHKVGSTTCTTCHGYHPESDEIVTRKGERKDTAMTETSTRGG